MAQLGFSIDSSQATKASNDLDKLVATSGKAEKGADGVSKAYRDMQASLSGITAILQSIDRNTAALAASANKAAPAIAQMDAAVGKARADFVAFDKVAAAVTMEMRGMEAVTPMVTQEFGRIAPAVNGATDALRRNTQAANENKDANAAAANAARSRPSNGGQANALNLGFQAQDIAMMTLMGQSPGMLALQQGMQVGGIFSQMGSAKNIVSGLGGAIAMLLNPLNLATIAAIGLGAAGVQAFMGMMGGADDASTALEKHNDFLDKTLAGYKDVRDAADSALEAALKMPQASVESNLGAEQEEAAKRTAAALEKVISLQKDFAGYADYAEAFNVPDDIAIKLQAVSTAISAVTADSELSRPELDQLHTVFTDLANSTADQNIKDIAHEALALVDTARQGSAEVDSLTASLNAIPRDVQIRISMNQSFGNAMDDLNSLYQDPRSKYDQDRAQARANAEWATNTATSYGQAVAAAENYERVLGSIDDAEAQANEKSNARAAKAADKPFDKWQTANDNFQRGIEQQQLEISLYGKSALEIARSRAEFDLLTSAKQSGIDINAQLANSDMTVAESIAQMAQQSAEAAVEMERLGDIYNTGKGVFSGFFGDLKSGIEDGKGLWQSLGDAAANALDTIANKALEMAASGIWDMLFNAGMSAFGGGGMMGGGSWNIPSGFQAGGFFPGFASGTNSAPGGLSWVGEQGPELMNVPRGAQIFNHQQSKSMVANQNQSNDNREVTVRLLMPEGWQAEVLDQAGQNAVKIVQQNEKGRGNYWQGGGDLTQYR